jgi:dTMP kinase
MKQPGLFITFEGIEGAGKSTQCRQLATALRESGRTVLETREPGGTLVGEKIRDLVKHFQGPETMAAETELLLFCASRAQLMRQIILPALTRGTIVICDRFADSTLVYQGFARGLDPDVIRQLTAFVTAGRMPDLTILLDLEVHAGLGRASRRSNDGKTDRFEGEARPFHQRIRDGFLTLARQEPQRFRVFDATQTPAELHDQILEAVTHALG